MLEITQTEKPLKCNEKLNLACQNSVIDISGHKMASNVKLVNFVFDSICFIVVLIVYIVIKITLYGTTEGLYPTKQGFLCGDTSIQKPLKEEYFHYEMVCSLSYVIPIVVVSYNTV